MNKAVVSHSNPTALQALAINPMEARQRGYPMKEQSALAKAAEDLTVG
jgi:hypothetical protein